MSGVYQIYNTVNGKRYIGSSIHIEQRFKEHLRNLRANKHVNAHLQSAWNKYGEHSAVRKRYSDYSNRPKGYWLKVIFSNDVKYYPSLREASRQLGIDKGAIQYCFKQKQGYCGKLNCTFIQISKEEYEEAIA